MGTELKIEKNSTRKPVQCLKISAYLSIMITIVSNLDTKTAIFKETATVDYIDLSTKLTPNEWKTKLIIMVIELSMQEAGIYEKHFCMSNNSDNPQF